MNTNSSKESNSPSVFISYSHADESWKDRLVKQLRVLESEGNFEFWDDRRIAAGNDWYPAIERALKKASAAILLISDDFLTSRFILGEEVPRLLRRRGQEGLRVIPLIVWPCAWQRVGWLKGIQSRPKDGRPLAKGSEYQIRQDLADLATEVDDLLKASLDKSSGQEEETQRGGISIASAHERSQRPIQREPRLLAADLLNKLLPGQFDEVMFRYGVPPQHVPRGATQNQQAIALIQYALQREGESLAQLLDTLRQVAPHLKHE